MHVAEGDLREVALAELEAEVVEIARTWEDRLARAPGRRAGGPSRGDALFDRWAERFPEYYSSSTPVELAAFDIDRFEELERSDEAFIVALVNAVDDRETLTRVRLYKVGGKVELSDFVPTLEALGLRVVEEVPTHLVGEEVGERYLHDFGVLGADHVPLDVDASGERIAGVDRRGVARRVRRTTRSTASS